MSEDEKVLTDAYYWLSMYKSGAITEGVAMEKVKEVIFAQPQLNENQLKTIKSWGNLAAGEFGQEWTEDDELTYRELFGESLTVLPDEVEEAE